MVPYGTIWYHIVPYGTIKYLMVPSGTLWYHKVPYGTIWYHMAPHGTIWYHMSHVICRTVGRSDGRTVGRSDGRSDGRTLGRSDGSSEGLTESRTDGLLHGRRAPFWLAKFPPAQTHRPAIGYPKFREISFSVKNRAGGFPFAAWQPRSRRQRLRSASSTDLRAPPSDLPPPPPNLPPPPPNLPPSRTSSAPRSPSARHSTSTCVCSRPTAPKMASQSSCSRSSWMASSGQVRHLLPS